MIMQGRKEQKQVLIKHKTKIYSSTLCCQENWAQIALTKKKEMKPRVGKESQFT